MCSQAFGLHNYVAPRRTRRIRQRTICAASAGTRCFVLRAIRCCGRTQEIDRLELPRIQNQAELDQLIASEELVPIVAGETLRFDPRLDPDRRYCRPWTRDFLEDLSEAYYNQFHSSDPGEFRGTYGASTKEDFAAIIATRHRRKARPRRLTWPASPSTFNAGA